MTVSSSVKSLALKHWPMPCSAPSSFPRATPKLCAVPGVLSGCTPTYWSVNTVNVQIKPKGILRDQQRAGSDLPGVLAQSQGPRAFPGCSRRALQHLQESLRVYDFIWPKNTPLGASNYLFKNYQTCEFERSPPPGPFHHPSAPPRSSKVKNESLSPLRIFPWQLCVSRGCSSDVNDGDVPGQGPPMVALT